MKAQFEYVASGLSFLRCNFKDTHTGELLGKLNDLWATIRGKHNHEFSFLYNAHVEKHFGEVFYGKYRNKGINKVYADSGGLQMITLGLSITPELKQQVYASQAEYSDYAMSFDEIPVSLLADRATRGDITNKYFDRSKFEWCARESGRNVRDQIQTFINKNSEAKPFFIVQGHDLDTYIRWTEYALEEIPEELHGHIGGVAMGSAGMGTGALEDCRRAFFFTQLPLFEKVNHVHLLGVGSVSRMIPTLAMIRAGLYKDILVSYDSTTHTSGVQMGRYYGPDFTWITPGKEFTTNDGPMYSVINEDVKRHYPEWDMEDELFHYTMNESVRRFQKKTGDPNPPILSFNAYFMGSTINFINHLNTVANDFILAEKIIGDKMYKAMDSFSKIKNREDYVYWENGIGRSSVPSQSLNDGLPATLDLL